MSIYIDAMIYHASKSPGYESYLHTLLDNLYDEKIENLKLIINMNQNSYFKKYEDRIEIINVKIRKNIDIVLLQNLFQLTHLKKEDIIIYTYNYGALIKRSKYILVIHDLQYKAYPQYWSLKKRIQRNMMVPISIRNATKIVAISQFTKQQIIKYYHVNNEKIEVIYNYINFDKFKLSDEINKNIDSSYILNVSSLEPHKNIILLLESYGKIRKKYNNLKLIIVGKEDRLTSDQKNIISQFNIYNDIVFVNNISNLMLARYYKYASAFILPSLYEGFGLPIAEALYFDIPVIISDIPICREIAGDFALFFNPYDVSELEKKISYIIEGGEFPKGKAYVTDKFSKSNTIDKYILLLKKLGREK